MLSDCHKQSLLCNVIVMHSHANACIILHRTDQSMQDRQSASNFHAGRCCSEVQLPHVRPGLNSGKAAVPRRVIGKLPVFCAPVIISSPVFAGAQPSVVVFAGKRQTPASENGHSTFAVQESMGKAGCSITM